MKYIKRFKNEADYQIFREGVEWITPNVSVINDKNEVKLVPQKKVNYISYFYDGTNVWIKSTYPVTSSICIQHSFSSDVGLSYLEIGENSKKLSTLPPGEDLTTGSIYGIGFNEDDAWNDNETLEDETYLYQIK
jgi:hypothetical protein